jgi:hypothetical protein
MSSAVCTAARRDPDRIVHGPASTSAGPRHDVRRRERPLGRSTGRPRRTTSPGTRCGARPARRAAGRRFRWRPERMAPRPPQPRPRSSLRLSRPGAGIWLPASAPAGPAPGVPAEVQPAGRDRTETSVPRLSYTSTRAGGRTGTSAARRRSSPVQPLAARFMQPSLTAGAGPSARGCGCARSAAVSFPGRAGRPTGLVRRRRAWRRHAGPGSFSESSSSDQGEAADPAGGIRWPRPRRGCRRRSAHCPGRRTGRGSPH